MQGRLLARSALLACASLTAVGTVSGSTTSGSQAAHTVRVDAREFSFELSRASVAAGSPTRFLVRNRGARAHRFRIAGKRTRLLRPGASQTISVRFPRRGAVGFLCTVPGHATRGMRGRLAVTPAPPAPPPDADPPAPPVTGSVVVTPIATLARPIHVTTPPDESDRLFVVEQSGRIRIVRDGEVLERPFLDLSDRIRETNESGLLSLAFAPDYAASGLFYVVYNQASGNGDLRVAEWRRHPTDPDLADPSGDRTLLTVEKPWENHNGGMLQFGPDGTLYVSIGDGDSGVVYPPGYFSQRRDSLLGSILRIDPRGGVPYAVPADNPFVDTAGVRPEIWAYGLRNPWRFWLDHMTGAMFIGDPGEGRREEIDLVPPGASGLNFGWPCSEAELDFDPSATCEDERAPLVAIPREGGVCAVIGGVVARDPRLPGLAGRYLYGDFCLGRITVILVEDGRVVASDDLGVDVPRLSSFGVDGDGRMYATSARGDVWRLDPASAG